MAGSLLRGARVDHATERERAEARWRHQATHDPLTGLVNRSLLDAFLRQAVAESSAAKPVRLMLRDFDYFKEVNDTWGHAAGDEVLRVLAERMKSSVRPNDVVARISGDEFVLLLKDADELAAAEVANRVLAAVSEPVRLVSGEMVVPSVSIGVTAHVQDESVEPLMARADETMYRAKALGGGRVEHG